MNYHHLRYFWLVARTGNLTQTARAQRVAQSALSMQIHALEEWFGHALFVRQGRQLVLTEAGRVVYEYADAIFSKGDELQETMRAFAAPQVQELRIGALATLSRNFQMEFLRPLFAGNERFVVRSGRIDELIVDLEAYRLDVVLSDVMPLVTNTASYHVHTIAQQTVSVVGRAGAYSQRGALAALLAEHPLVVPARPSSIRTDFDAALERMGVQPDIVAEIDDMAMLRLVAREHRGLTVVPPIVVRDELERGELVEYARIPGIRETFYALTVPRRFTHRALPQLLAHVTELDWGAA